MYKRCATCKTEKMLSQFRKDSRRLNGVRSSCKECDRQYHKSVYAQRYSEKNNARNKQRFAIVKEWIATYKSERGCIVCKEREVCCLDLHHLDPSAKEFTISGNQNRSFVLVQEEVRKCIVVCRNCHAKIHAGLIGEVPEPGLSEQS
jgi:hypothetical protein